MFQKNKSLFKEPTAVTCIEMYAVTVSILKTVVTERNTGKRYRSQRRGFLLAEWSLSKSMKWIECTSADINMVQRLA